jgi:hypothetical protein
MDSATANVTHLNTSHTVIHRVAEVLKDLPPGHSRHEAFELIRKADIRDSKGKPISPSMYYHATCKVPRSNGEPYIKQLNPNFVTSETPYPRATGAARKPIVVRGMRVTKATAHQLASDMILLKSDFLTRWDAVMDRIRAMQEAAPADEAPQHTEAVKQPEPVPAPPEPVKAKQIEASKPAANKSKDAKGKTNQHRMRKSA